MRHVYKITCIYRLHNVEDVICIKLKYLYIISLRNMEYVYIIANICILKYVYVCKYVCIHTLIHTQHMYIKICVCM